LYELKESSVFHGLGAMAMAMPLAVAGLVGMTALKGLMKTKRPSLLDASGSSKKTDELVR
jgi:hypothetical protein